MKKRTMVRRMFALVLAVALTIGLLPTGMGAVEAKAAATSEEGTYTVNKKDYKYTVTLPDGYKSEVEKGRHYPVIYVMPDNGLKSESTKLVDEIKKQMVTASGTPMIIVEPQFAKEDDFRALMADLVDDVDKDYSTVPAATARAVVGTKIGGYMAYISGLSKSSDGTLLTEPQLFGAVASMAGDFVSEKNTLKAKYGDVYTDLISKSATADLNNFYTYLDAPTEDPNTYAQNSTNTIGDWFISKYTQLPSSVNEFTVRYGVYDDAYLTEAATRLTDRLGDYFLKGMVTGSFKLSTTMATTDASDIKGDYSINVSKLLNDYLLGSKASMEIKLTMTDPDTGKEIEETSKSQTVDISDLNKPITGKFDVANKVNGLSTTCTLTATIFGKSIEIASANLVRIQSTGSKEDEQLIDLMGDWHFNAYKSYGSKDADPLDDVKNLKKEDWEKWGVVQPGLGWWSADFDKTLNNNSNWSGYAWYVREFDIPDNFPKTGLKLAGGKFDEADAFYVNGVKVGATGIQEDGTYDGSNPWEVSRLYDLDSKILNYGGKNTIAVRMCNSSGGGGWYEGPIGIYSMPAYNKSIGKPSKVAANDVTEAIQKVVADQNVAIEDGDLDKFAETVDPQYFNAGVNKEDLLKGLETYAGKNTIDDSNPMVYTVGDKYLYQAVRNYKVGDKVLSAEDIEYYFEKSGDTYVLTGAHDRFFYTKYQSKALGQEMGYQVYLPEGYFDDKNSNKRYPSLYLLHGLNSTSQTYVIDDVNELLDEAIEKEELEETIVIIPDSSAMSWWARSYATMLTEDLLPLVDSKYRTIPDARFRGTAGCSMGGLGAYNIAIRNPKLFSSVVSFYGAFKYGAMGDGNPVTALQGESAEYANYFSHYLTCGNRDVYTFGRDAIQMDALLRADKVDHQFSIDNGEHDSIYYLPRFIEGLKWTNDHRYETASDITKIISDGKAVSELKGNTLSIDYSAKISDDVSKYLNVIPKSSFSDKKADTTQALTIPVTVAITQDGKIVASGTNLETASKATTISGTIALDMSDVDSSTEYKVTVTADLLGQSVLLTEDTVKALIKDVKVNTAVEPMGHCLKTIEVTVNDRTKLNKLWDDGLKAEDFTLEGKAYRWMENTTHDFTAKVSKIDKERNVLILTISDFTEKYFYVDSFTVACSKDPRLTFTSEKVSKVVTPIADDFQKVRKADGAAIDYNIYTPNADEPVPVVVALHGYGDTENLLQNQLAVAWASPENQAVRPCYVIAPLIADWRQQDTIFEETHTIIQKLIAEGKVDSKRVYVVGKSMGGKATFDILDKYPDFFAAAIPMCAAGSPQHPEKLVDIPIWIAHATMDDTVKVETSRNTFKALQDAGSKVVKFTEFSKKQMDNAGVVGGHHSVEVAVLTDPAFMEWLFDQTLQTRLDKIEQGNQAAADVDALIDAIGSVTKDSQAAIDAAKKAYDALTDEQKAKVKNADILQAAQQTYAEITTNNAKITTAKENAAKVDALISAIGKVSTASKSKIDKARKAYNALDELSQMYVSGYATLRKAEVDYTDAVTVSKMKAPAKPVIKVAKSGKKALKISWKKIKDAKGYKVYRSTKKSKGYKLVKTIKKGSTVKFIDKNVKKGKTYYYKVRAYKKVSGTTIYSKYSAVKSKKR